MSTNIICIAGKSNSGKTTLLEKLIGELTLRGYRIGTAKHAHNGFEIDKKGKDSWRHKQAGAKATLVVTERRIALVKDDLRPPLEKLADHLGDMDIILLEGFKRQPLPKIEIFRTGSGHAHPLFLDSEELVAFVTDSEYRPEVPCFGLNDIKAIASFIEEKYLPALKKETILSSPDPL